MSKLPIVILNLSCVLCSVVSASHEVCFEPKKPGQCRAAIPRYFYNTTTCKCDKFYWGGCESNGNNFEQLTECRSTCNQSMPLNPICAQPEQFFFCKGIPPRWRFNSASCKCESFDNGKCGTNDNNFETEAECLLQCGCSNCACQLPIKPKGDGLIACMAHMPSFGFNTTSCQCEPFIYTGCGGNENRFSTLEECQERCSIAECDTCGLPADSGLCKALIPRYFYNKNTCQCEVFNWGGCGGNGNNYMTLNECMNSCGGFATCDTNPRQCYLPKNKGDGKALLERFYYDQLECKCKKFTYGGSNGNDNNFSSKKKCKKACRNATCPICNLPRVSGRCRGFFMRYFYNITSCKCEEFVYGGCSGNENRFESLDECQGVCGSLVCPICNLPSLKGPCNGNITLWYYDVKKCKCEEFRYGSCGGNMNRFLTENDCKGSCGGYPCHVCTLPKEVGLGSDAIPRWFFNSRRNKCRKFTWTGDKSNGNNFRTRKLCNNVCKFD